jgi:hypothetical protein
VLPQQFRRTLHDLGQVVENALGSGVAAMIAASNRPWPPPTSMMVWCCDQSYPATRGSTANSDILVIASLKIAASSGCCSM